MKINKKVSFLRVKEIKEEVVFYQGVYPSMADLVEWIRQEYAKDCYWVKEKNFERDVEIPTCKPSTAELNTKEGEKMLWNYHLSKLISSNENGTLLDKAIQDVFISNDFLVIEILGKDMFVNMTDEDVLKSLEVENVTDEFLPQFIEAINSEEIEEFVNTHNQKEVEDKYCSRFIKESEVEDTMWEF